MTDKELRILLSAIRVLAMAPTVEETNDKHLVAALGQISGYAEAVLDHNWLSSPERLDVSDTRPAVLRAKRPRGGGTREG